MSSPELCCDRACPPLPDGFVRLRYFFGKRLGVADLRDEQAYHRAKMRFHNRHLHGFGVVCGLGLSRFGEDETVLRVGRGAALDSCGREILVPWDQCIDLEAWFARRVDEAERVGETFPAASPFRVCVAVRYRECPTTPEAAPRDPCSCDTGGCEYGRVQEGFELTLLTEEEAAPYEAPPDPVGPGLPCAEGRDPDWVVLGCLVLTVIDDALAPLPPESEWSGPPIVLESTASLGARTDAEASATLDLEERDSAALLAIGFPVAPAEGSVAAKAFTLHRLEASGWKSARFTVEQDGATVRLVPGRNFLRAGGRYRVTTVGDATPIVDDMLRPLRLQRSFHLTADGDAVALTITSTS